jgi:hypothetical protein
MRTTSNANFKTLNTLGKRIWRQTVKFTDNGKPDNIKSLPLSVAGGFAGRQKKSFLSYCFYLPFLMGACRPHSRHFCLKIKDMLC